jgi:DNA-binding IclR family transcriptional regulator
MNAMATRERIGAIVHALQEDPGQTAPQLAEHLGVSRRHAALLLLRLEELGYVEHDGRRWFPPPD